MANVMTKINGNILDHVFFSVKCNNCGTHSVLSGDILSKAQVACNQCKTVIQGLHIDHHLLGSLHKSIGDYCTQLQNADLELYFVHQPESTIEIPNPKSSLGT